MPVFQKLRFPGPIAYKIGIRSRASRGQRSRRGGVGAWRKPPARGTHCSHRDPMPFTAVLSRGAPWGGFRRLGGEERLEDALLLGEAVLDGLLGRADRLLVGVDPLARVLLPESRHLLGCRRVAGPFPEAARMPLGACVADEREPLRLLAFDRPVAPGIRFLLLSRETEVGLTLRVKAISVAFCSWATPVWITFLCSKVNRWQGCVTYSVSFRFLVGNGDIFASNRLGLNACWSNV